MLGLECRNDVCSMPLPMPLAMQGEACSDDSDCDTDLVCIEDMCDIAPAAGMLGDFCAPDLPCGEGLMCEDSVCVMSLGMMGDACSEDTDCDTDLVCIESMCDTAPLPGMLGDFCFLPSLPCGEGLMCDDNSVCVVSSGMIGDACLVDEDCQSNRCVGEICAASLQGEGEHCHEAEDCQPGLVWSRRVQTSHHTTPSHCNLV